MFLIKVNNKLQCRYVHKTRKTKNNKSKQKVDSVDEMF